MIRLGCSLAIEGPRRSLLLSLLLMAKWLVNHSHICIQPCSPSATSEGSQDRPQGKVAESRGLHSVTYTLRQLLLLPLLLPSPYFSVSLLFSH